MSRIYYFFLFAALMFFGNCASFSKVYSEEEPGINQYQVYATVNGLIQQILVKEGDVVKKGDALFIVQSETAQLNSENAKLAADFADFNTRGDRLRELKGIIETTQSKMLNDSLLLQRQRGLWALLQKIHTESLTWKMGESSSNRHITSKTLLKIILPKY